MVHVIVDGPEVREDRDSAQREADLWTTKNSISMMPSAGLVVVSTMPNTHCSERGGRPQWCCEYHNIKNCTELSMFIVYLGLVAK